MKNPFRIVGCFVLAWAIAGCSDPAPPATTPNGWLPLKPKKDVAIAPEADSAGPGTDDPGTDQPDADEPGTDDPDAVVDPDVAVPDPDAAQPDPDAAQPDPDAAQPDPDAAQPAPDTTGPQPDTATPQPDTKADTADAAVKPKCQDDDQDEYGENCDAGPDCDDYNPNFHTTCPDCSKGNVPGCSCKGKSAPCYSGDSAWIGKGVCKAGVQPCKDAFWGECSGEVLPDSEKCDDQDNDCDGATDEGVKSSCGTCDMSCSQQSVGVDTGNPFDLNSENSTGVGLDPAGKIIIDQTKISLNLKYIWVSNSPESTVSKVDCKTGWEVGRYKVCSDPSRTSVDLQGNVWVACRGDGKVVKIMAEKQNCVDKNANGNIETAFDSSNDHKIQPNEMIQGGQGVDECVKFIAHPGGSNSAARGTGVDKENHAWIGKYDNKLYRLEPEKGAVVDTINIGVGSYGLVIDQKGIIWVQGGQLTRVDPTTKAITKHGSIPGQYGINVDKFGKIWIGSYSVGAGRYDPLTGQWATVPGVKQASGIATSNDGFVYTANDGCKCITKINAQTLTKVGEVPIGGSPHGIALDYDGFVWGVNWGGNTISKVDPKAMVMVGDYPVGPNPYTYSDMTGYTLNYFTAPKGQYVATFFGGTIANPIMVGSTKVKWQTIAVTADLPEKTAIQVRYRTGNDKNSLEVAKWTEPLSFPPAKFPLDVSKAPEATGLLLQVELQLITSEKGLSPAVTSVVATSKVE